MAVKEGYPHFMINEINEQSTTVKNTLNERIKLSIADEIKGEINKILFVACGIISCINVLEVPFGISADIQTEVLLASEFKYCASSLNENRLVNFFPIR